MMSLLVSRSSRSLLSSQRRPSVLPITMVTARKWSISSSTVIVAYFGRSGAAADRAVASLDVSQVVWLRKRLGSRSARSSSFNSSGIRRSSQGTCRVSSRRFR
jgi:hypothetical protein